MNLPEVAEGVQVKLIPDFPDYAVTDTGDVWSKRVRHESKRTGVWKKLARCVGTTGYVTARITNGNYKTFSVHRMVLEAFIGPPPKGTECCHGNGVRDDNRIENLRWGTYSSNSADKEDHGTLLFGEDNPYAKLTEIEAMAIRYRASGGQPYGEIARVYGVSTSTISLICRGVNWSRAGGPVLGKKSPESRNHNSKLREDDVREIRVRYKAGERQALIADSFNVSQRTVSSIVTRRSWKHT